MKSYYSSSHNSDIITLNKENLPTGIEVLVRLTTYAKFDKV